MVHIGQTEHSILTDLLQFETIVFTVVEYIIMRPILSNLCHIPLQRYENQAAYLLSSSPNPKTQCTISNHTFQRLISSHICRSLPMVSKCHQRTVAHQCSIISTTRRQIIFRIMTWIHPLLHRRQSLTRSPFATELSLGPIESTANSWQ